MKSHVYILKNEKTGRYYLGSSGNLERRLKQHLAGSTRTTRRLKTFTLVYKEEFDTVDEARAREKKLKSYKSHKYLDWLIQKSHRINLD